MRLPGWSCAASNFIFTSHIVEYPMARSDQDSIRADGGASILIRNAKVKEVGRYNTVRGLLSDVQVMLRQTGKLFASTYPGQKKRKKDYTSQVQLRALRKGPLTSKLARASPRRFTGPA
eukprot:1160111-Pelagomonas_calceolata.AAC.16